MFNFLTIDADWVERNCKLKNAHLAKCPRIQCSTASYNLIKHNEITVLKRSFIPYRFRGYEIVIDDSMELGIVEII